MICWRNSRLGETKMLAVYGKL